MSAPIDANEGTDPMLLRQRLDGAVITTYILLMLVVPLRFWCRKVGNAGFWLDDWLSIVSLVFANGLFYVVVITIRPYLGFHANEVGLDGVGVFVKSFLPAQLFYTVSVGLTKLSILAFYWRLFAVAGKFRILAVSFIVFSWVVIICSLVLFQCKPIEAVWNIMVTEKTCISTKSIYKGGSIPNIITDFILIVMPLPHIWQLQIRLAQRLVLGGVFTVGLFVLIVSIIRFNIVMQQDVNDPDITYNMFEVVVWSVVEVNVGLICACLPSLRPVFTFLHLGRFFSTTPGGDGSTNANSAVPAQGRGQARRRSKLKGSSGGMFSSISGLTKMDHDEEGFVMIDNDPKKAKSRNGHMWGKNQSAVEATQVSDDEAGSAHKASVENSRGITVQNEWTVRVDDASQSRR